MERWMGRLMDIGDYNIHFVFLHHVIFRILHECSCFIEFIKRVGEKR